MLGEVGRDISHRGGDLRPELGIARVVDLHREQPVGPGTEQLAVPGRQAQQLGDDDHRQGKRQGVDEVEPLACGVEELAGHGTDTGFEGGDGARRERGADQLAQGAVLRRVDLGQHAAPDLGFRGDEPGGVGGEGGRVPGDSDDVVVPEDMPDAVAIWPDRVLRAHRAQPLEQGQLVLTGGRDIDGQGGAHGVPPWAGCG